MADQRDPMDLDIDDPADADIDDDDLIAIHAMPARARPIRRRRRDRVRRLRQRRTYTETEKRRAVDLLNMGVPCRRVAALLGPNCSSGTPIRWRQQFRAGDRARANIEDIIRRAGAALRRPNPAVLGDVMINVRPDLIRVPPRMDAAQNVAAPAPLAPNPPNLNLAVAQAVVPNDLPPALPLAVDPEMAQDVPPVVPVDVVAAPELPQDDNAQVAPNLENLERN